MKFLSSWIGGALVACSSSAAGELWVGFPEFADEAAYRNVAGVQGVSGSLPKGWSDGSSWSGSKVRYAFRKDGASGYLHAEVSGEGMCQFYNPSIPALDRLGCFRLVVRGRSASGSDVILGVRDTEGDHAYAVMAKIPLGEAWKEYVVPVSGGPSAQRSAFYIEMFSPGTVDLASVRLERIPADQYVPATAQAAARDDAWWRERSQALAEAAARAQPEFLLMGDSITQRWEQNGQAAWAKEIAPFKSANFGIDGDGTEHLLWRIRHSGLGTRFKPRLVALLIGVNNLGADVQPNDVILGLAACVKAVRQQSPESKVLILGVFPAAQSADDGVRAAIRAVNAGYAALADNQKVFFADIGPSFLEQDGSLSKTIMEDFLHLTPKGYGLYAGKLAPILTSLLQK
jgi:lysophospholipase L1-like esterase